MSPPMTSGQLHLAMKIVHRLVLEARHRSYSEGTHDEIAAILDDADHIANLTKDSDDRGPNEFFDAVAGAYRRIERLVENDFDPAEFLDAGVSAVTA